MAELSEQDISENQLRSYLARITDDYECIYVKAQNTVLNESPLSDATQITEGKAMEALLAAKANR